MRRLSLVAKDGSGAEAGKAKLPLGLWGSRPRCFLSKNLTLQSMRRLSLVAKDGDGAEAGKAELPLVVSGELVVGEATVRVRGGEAAGVTAKLTYPEPMGKPVTLTSGATLEARPNPECCCLLITQSTGALLQSGRTGGPCPDLISGLLCMRSPDMWGEAAALPPQLSCSAQQCRVPPVRLPHASCLAARRSVWTSSPQYRAPLQRYL